MHEFKHNGWAYRYMDGFYWRLVAGLWLITDESLVPEAVKLAFRLESAE